MGIEGFARSRFPPEGSNRSLAHEVCRLRSLAGGFGSWRRGQAFMELAMGMLALALVLAATFGFIEYILSSLEMQRSLRAEAGRNALVSSGTDGAFVTAKDTDTVTVEPMAAEYIFGSEKVEVREEVHMPVMGGILQ